MTGQFTLTVEPGEFTDSEIIVMLGENGTGKTTFIKMLAGKLEPDSGGKTGFIALSKIIGFKPKKLYEHQMLKPKEQTPSKLQKIVNL